MIKAIAIDLGGVLFSEGKSVMADKLHSEMGYDKELLYRLLLTKKSIDLRKGFIGDMDFWNWFQNQLPPNYDASLIKKEWYESYLLDEEMFTLMKQLKPKYQLIAFSGNIKSRVEYLEDKYHFRKIFYQEIYSYDYHLIKPQRKFVEKMIEVSGLKPDEILYIDDDERSLSVASECGVNVVVYKGDGVSGLMLKLREKGITV